VILLALTIAFAILWVRAQNGGNWLETGGQVISGEATRTHYNSPDYRHKVSIRYSYQVNGAPFTGSWTGFWPSTHSPNALPAQAVHRAAEPGHRLVVLYNPNRPSISRLHDRPAGAASAFAWLTGAGVLISLVYFVYLYPRLRGALPV